MKKNKNLELYKHEQLHLAISLYITANFLLDKEMSAWRAALNADNTKSNNLTVDKALMIKNISVGTTLIFAYAIENLVKAFNSSIPRRHLKEKDIPINLFNSAEEGVIRITLLPLLQWGKFRYPQEENKKKEIMYLSSGDLDNIFIKLFKHFIEKNKLIIPNIPAFKNEFIKYNYPFVSKLF